MNLAEVLNADRVPAAFEAGLRLGQEQASAVKVAVVATTRRKVQRGRALPPSRLGMACLGFVRPRSPELNRGYDEISQKHLLHRQAAQQLGRGKRS